MCCLDFVNVSKTNRKQKDLRKNNQETIEKSNISKFCVTQKLQSN